MSPATRTFAFILLSCAFGFAQAGKPSGGSSGGGTTTGPSTPTNNSNSTVVPNRPIPPLQQQQQQPQMPIILTGNVVMDDGSRPTDRISIERVCNGRALREGYTDSKGYFSITIGGGVENTVIQDASSDVSFNNANQPTFGGMGVNGGFGSAMGSQTGLQSGTLPLFGCELRAALPGTISDVIELSDKRSMGDPNVGTIVLHRIGRVDGATVSVTSLQAPKDAKKAYDKGRKEWKKKHPDKAEEALSQAVQLYPNYAEAWAQLGEIYLGNKQYDKAEMASQKALQADPHFITPYFTLISLFAARQDWKTTEAYSDKLLALDGYHYPAAYYFNALASLEQHNTGKALRSIEQAKRYDIRNSLPKTSLLMAQIKEARGDYAGAVQAYKAFLERESQGPAADFARKAMNDAQTKVAAAGPPPAAPKN